ncbi:MAG: succinate dehydrogenase/fumarate reductase iron-sulfur subunit [Bdellovibrionales bacterium]|nr:succinate dehydrogenase/fumarate reductase iron-sulfur subunit [Bdellovibrionales bacterium]
MMSETISLNLRIWRQKDAASTGKFVDYKLENISTHMSFLEMIDVLNEKLIANSEDPIAFDHDCREGICGMCSMVINGNPHGPDRSTTTCQLHMRRFKTGDTITIEPFRANSFPIVKDLMVNRSAFDRIQQSGGFISVNTGNSQDANSLPIPKQNADAAFEAAACIGCGACVASCKNASAMLFVAAKVSQFALLPQGQPERESRAMNMLAKMDEEGFGACSNTGSCSAACPKDISLSYIAKFNREYMRAKIKS